MTYKVKFRVYNEIKCVKCDCVHPMPTKRFINHELESDGEEQAINKAHIWATKILDAEKRGHRALYQSTTVKS